MKKIQVLHYIPGFNTGGIESVFLNWYKNLDTEKVNFELLVRNYDADSPMVKEYLELGGKLQTLQTPSLNPRTMWSFRKKVKQFFKNNFQYDFLHVHVADDPFVIAEAQKSGIRKIAIHAHTTGYNISYKSQGLKGKIRMSNVKKADACFACSKAAVDWMFPESIRKGKPLQIIHNGIAAEKYTFQPSVREQYRKELGLEEQFALVHVGRFSEVKNHPFMLKVFQELQKKEPNSCLLFVGDGPLFSEIKSEIEEMKLSKKVKLLGARGDVANILQAADVFLLPSAFEGLGMGAIEAQAAGMPTFVSDSVPREAAVTDLVTYLNLNDGAEKWAEEIMKYKSFERRNTFTEIEAAHYDIKQTTADLEKAYREILTGK